MDAVLGLLLYQSNSLQHISDIVDSSFLPHCQGVRRLNDRTKAMKNTIEITGISFSRLIATYTDKDSICANGCNALHPKNPQSVTVNDSAILTSFPAKPNGVYQTNDNHMVGADKSRF